MFGFVLPLNSRNRLGLSLNSFYTSEPRVNSLCSFWSSMFSFVLPLNSRNRFGLSLNSFYTGEPRVFSLCSFWSSMFSFVLPLNSLDRLCIPISPLPLYAFWSSLVLFLFYKPKTRIRWSLRTKISNKIVLSGKRHFGLCHSNGWATCKFPVLQDESRVISLCSFWSSMFGFVLPLNSRNRLGLSLNSFYTGEPRVNSLCSFWSSMFGFVLPLNSRNRLGLSLNSFYRVSRV